MAILHEATKEVICKIVYHGAGKCGKTTSLLYMNHHLPPAQRGRFVTLETPTERTLFFDLLPVKAQAGEYKFRFLLFATPGQEYYDASRRLILKGADAIVFVVDSQRERMQDNWEAMELLEKNLKDLGQRMDALPMVLQYNKRDLSNIMPPEDMERRYNTRKPLSFPAGARTGEGVYETFLTVAKMALTRLSAPSAEAAMGPLFRSLVFSAEDAEKLGGMLDKLNLEAGLRGSLLVDESSGILGSRGNVSNDDAETLGALLASNFAAAQELSSNLSRRGFVGLTQRGRDIQLRAARVDQRRFLVLVTGRNAERKALKNAVTYVKGPMAAWLQQLDAVSPNRLDRFHDLFSSVASLAVAGMRQP